MIAIIEQELSAVADLCRRYGARSLDLFGSAATDRFEASRSDLDFLVEFDRHDTLGPADQYFGLQESLEGLLGRKVDLVTRRSLRNPWFIASIERSKRRLFGTSWFTPMTSSTTRSSGM